jgi:hypothetical protein
MMTLLFTNTDIVPIISCAVLAIAFLVGLGKMISENKRDTKEREEGSRTKSAQQKRSRLAPPCTQSNLDYGKVLGIFFILLFKEIA